jgi:hypothetical protein
VNISVKIPKQQHVTILLPVRNQHWTVKRDRYGATGPYAYSGDQWVGYEDINSVKEKVHVLPVNVRTYKFWYITDVCVKHHTMFYVPYMHVLWYICTTVMYTTLVHVHSCHIN